MRSSSDCQRPWIKLPPPPPPFSPPRAPPPSIGCLWLPSTPYRHDLTTTTTTATTSTCHHIQSRCLLRVLLFTFLWYGGCLGGRLSCCSAQLVHFQPRQYGQVSQTVDGRVRIGCNLSVDQLIHLLFRVCVCGFFFFFFFQITYSSIYLF